MPVIRLDGKVITFPLKKADALFFYMCTEKSATRTRLATLLWGGASDAAARKNLRNALYAIKQAFGFDPFESPKKQILNLNSSVIFHIDTDDFLETGDLQLYQDVFLSGFSLKDSYEYDEWMNSVRSRMADHYLHCLYLRFQRLQPDDITGREDIFHRYTSSDPLDERIYILMMQTYLENSQLLKGVRCYEDLRALLSEELAISPSVEAQAVFNELKKQLEQSSGTSGIGDGDGRLIGRDRETAVLRRCWQDLVMRRAGTVFLSGEKGIGKTFLCDAFLDSLSEENVLILRADCLEHEKQIPLRCWSSILTQARQFMQSEKIEVPARYREVVHSFFPTLDSLGKSGADLSELPASYSYRAVRNALLQLLSVIAEKMPVILYVNDLTNMDELSADSFSTLIRNNRGNFLILITCPSHMEPGWEKYVSDLVRFRGVQKLILQPLGREEVERYLLRKFPEQTFPPALLDSLMKECRGNPFYLNLIAGHLYEGADAETIGNAEHIIHGIFASLPAGERRLLDLISVFQDGAAAEPLTFITGTNAMDMIYTLDDLIERGLLTEEAHGAASLFRFRHNLLLDYIRTHLSPSKTRLYHKRIAEYLLQSSLPRTGSWYTQIIYHFEGCGAPVKSLFYRILQLEEFAKYNYDLYPVLSLSEKGSGGSAPAVLQELFSLEKQLSRFYHLFPGEIPYEEAACRLSLIIGRIAIQQGDYDAGLRALKSQIEGGTFLSGNPRLERAYHRQLVFYGIQTWNLPVMEAALEKCLAIDRQLGEIHETAIDRRLRGLYCGMKGDLDESDQLLQAAIEDFQSSALTLQSYTLNIAGCYNYLGENARIRKNYDQSILYFRRALSLCRENDQMENPIFYVNLAITYYNLGDLKNAEACIRQSRQLYDASDVQMGRSISLTGDAYLLHHAGKDPEALAAMTLAADCWQKLGSPRDAFYYFYTASVLKKEAPEVFASLLPEPWESYREKADATTKEYSTLR